MKPKTETANVDILGFGVQVSNVVKDSSSGVIRFDVVGTNPSKQPGDRLLIAHHNTGANFPPPTGFPVTVIVPGAIAGPDVTSSSGSTYQHDTTGTLVVKNMALNLTTMPTANVDKDHLELDTVYARFLTIMVVDQFGDPLGDLYKGAEVEENLFGTPVSINSPLSDTGTYIDPVGVLLNGNTQRVAKNDPSVGLWLAPNAGLRPLPQSSRTEDRAVSVD